MKVIFKVVRTGSGNDIYFQRLSQALKKINIDSQIEYYPRYFQYIPWLLHFFNKKTAGDVIHSNVEYGWVFKENDKPLYITLHHNVFDKNYQRYVSFPQRVYYEFILKPNTKKSLKIADKIIAVSKYTRNSFINSFGNYNIQVIYNFIDTNKFKPKKVRSSDKRFKLLFVGNLTKRKGADLLPMIMSKLGNDYVLYYTSGLRTNIPKQFNLPNMIPLGKLSEEELIIEYNKCDALLFPSRLEGFGYAIAEAMSCGKPIIAINNSSIPELVADGINGILFYDMPTDILYGLRAIASLKNKKYLVNRRKVLDQFDEQKVIKNYEESY